MKRKLGENDQSYALRLERDHQIVLLLEEADLTLREIGKRFGISHEMVRLIGKSRDGLIEQRQIRQEELYALAVREEQEAGRVSVDEAWTIIDSLPRCVVCQSPVPAGLVPRRSVTCSTRCAAAWLRLRYILSDEFRDQNRISTAVSILRYPKHHSTAQTRYARRVVAGTAPPPNRRWITQSHQDILDEFGITTNLPLALRREKS